MRLGDRVRAFLGRLQKNAVLLIPTWQRGQPQYSPVSVLTYIKDYYKKNEVAYACIKEIARSASEAALKIYRKAKDGTLEEQPDHPLQQLMDMPNPRTSQYEMHEAILTDMNVAGEAFVYKEPSGADRTVGLHRLRPDRVTVIPGPMGEVVAYKYSAGDVIKEFEAERVIHFPFFNPDNDYRGLSPMEVAHRVLDVDVDLTDYIKKFFEQGAMIPGFLKYLAGTLSQAERKRIRKQFAEVYGGASEWFAPAVFDVDMTFEKTGMTYKEMEFGDLRSTMEIRICMIFGVPPILLPTKFGLDAATYSNYGMALKSFWEDTLSPLYRRIQDKWQIGLAPDFGNNLIMKFDFSEVKALQEDKNEAWARATAALQAGGITVNQFLEEIGKPAIGGDVFLRPMMLMEIPSREMPGKGFTIAMPDYKRLTTGRLKYPEEKAERWSYMINATARAWEGRFKETAQGLFEEEKKGVLRILRREGKQAKKGVPFQDFLLQAEHYLRMAGEAWREEFLPLFTTLLQAQGETISAAFGIEFDITNPATQTWLEEYSMQFAEQIEGLTEERVRAVIMEAQSEGWSVPTTRKALTDLYDGFDRVRAERIARTETIRSSNAGAVQAYREAGVIKKEWYTSIDGRQCAYCEALHQRVIGIEEIYIPQGTDFVVEGAERALRNDYANVDYPPAHVNCRCTVLPVIEEA